MHLDVHHIWRRWMGQTYATMFYFRMGIIPPKARSAITLIWTLIGNRLSMAVVV